MTGLPWNLAFADAVEKIIGGDTGRSRVIIVDRSKIQAERPHPKAAYSR
jgi:hypothetical protein